MQHQASILRRWLTPVALFAGGWCLLIGLFAAQWVIVGSATWREALRLAVPFWGIWVVASPLVAWGALQWPLEGPRFWLRLLAHAGGCFLVVLMSQATMRDRPAEPQRGPAGAGRPFPPAVRDAMPPEPLPRSRGSGRPRMGPPRPVLFRITVDVVVYLAIVSGCHAMIFLGRSRQRERVASQLRSHLAQARLEALRNQLNPHFLFNTLNGISTLVHTSPDAADEMIASLSGLLRASLDTAQVHEVRLDREMEILQHYLDIEHARFGDRLRVEKDVPAETVGALVPTLILQPLVENAIRHGIEPRLAPGTVGIRSFRRDGTLVLEVRDNGMGPGIAGEERPGGAPALGDRAADAGGMATPGQGRGIGMSNTRARLEALYGDRQRLTMTARPEGGCLVTLEIPFHEGPAANGRVKEIGRAHV